MLERTHFGAGPAFSEELSAWLHPAGTTLRIADDREGFKLWLTSEECERAENERERVAREAAERKILDLEARLSRE